MLEWLMNDELERIWKDIGHVLVKVLSYNFPRGAEKNRKIPKSE
jgi:hypothetical protein